MSFKRLFLSAALWFLATAGLSVAGPAEATGYFRYHYYQPYGHYYPHHGYRPHYYGRGHGHYSYFGYPGSYCPPSGYYSQGYYQPLIEQAIGAIVTHGLFGHYYH